MGAEVFALHETPETVAVLFLDDGNLIEVSPDGYFRYTEHRILRQGTPKVAGVYVLFEGLIGVLDGKLQEVHYKDLKDDKRKAALAEMEGVWEITALIPRDDREPRTASSEMISPKRLVRFIKACQNKAATACLIIRH